jgi:heme-degrading monooxygenase HmoA
VTVTKKGGYMAIKVLIKRHVKKGNVVKVVELLKQIRKTALTQKGYISGETLLDHYNQHNIVIISTWDKIDDWIRWEGSEERAANESIIEKLLEVPTKYEVYDIGNMQA